MKKTSTSGTRTVAWVDNGVEGRSHTEVSRFGSDPVAPDGQRIHNPSLDITPAELVTALITEVGVVRAPYGASLRAAFELGSHNATQ